MESAFEVLSRIVVEFIVNNFLTIILVAIVVFVSGRYYKNNQERLHSLFDRLWHN